MVYSDTPTRPGASAKPIAGDVYTSLFKQWKLGPTFSDPNGLFLADGSGGELRSTAKADYSTAGSSFSGDFYFHW